MRKHIFLIIVLSMALALVSSCSGGTDVLIPSGEQSQKEYRSPLLEDGLAPDNWADHTPLLFCTFMFDLEKNTVQVVENHTAQAHFNVKPMLNDPLVCPNLNCITVALVDYDPALHTYTVEVTLRNPTNLTAYDVRGIMFLNPNKDTALLNPDNYIILYDTLEQINPFKAFAKSAPNRQYPPASVYSEYYEVYIPPPPPLFNINYAIDISWPTNCKEPYEISDIAYSGNLTPVGGIGTIRCNVDDHQDDIESVQVDLHSITGNVEDLLYDSDNDQWYVNFSNDMMQPIGQYRCLLSAKSTGSPLKLYDYVTVEIIPGADQSITGKVYDCYNMSALEGAEISVYSQDLGDYLLPPAVVTGGIYDIVVDSGTYDMAISTAGYDLMVCNGVILPAGETYEADFGLNITAPFPGEPNGNPYPYTGGIVGKVTDAVTGNPIPDAAIIVGSGQLNIYDSPPPTFSSGAACNDNGYYSVTEAMCSADSYSYTPVGGWTFYASAPGYEGEFYSDSTVSIENNVVVPNIHFQLNPIETGKTVIFSEDFENNPQWTFELYTDQYGYSTTLSLWHVQTWNASIVNIFQTNGWVYSAPDETDGGIIPEPPVSAYNPGPNTSYLWYGQEAEGSFIGPYDTGLQTPGGGGMSSIEHGGWAISPTIDLTGFTNGQLALESIWEIESMNASGFDYMEIYIRDDSSNDYMLDFLNPAIDPFTSGDPISSGGHNRDAVWDHLVYDITPYMGNQYAHVVFLFYTSDSAYNGFKGWFVDNVKIYGY